VSPSRIKAFLILLSLFSEISNVDKAEKEYLGRAVAQATCSRRRLQNTEC
jgi:hypothetical protein